MIVIGASLGGHKALKVILRHLPRSYPFPVAVVLHRHKDADDYLFEFLEDALALRVHEVTDKEPIRAGHIYVAPPDYHLLVEENHFSLSTDEPVQYARPSIDVLFESAADSFGAQVIGVVLTGANHDGARGAAEIQRRGGTILVQNPATAECAVMPRAALEATQTPHILSLNEISERLLEMASTHFTDQP